MFFLLSKYYLKSQLNYIRSKLNAKVIIIGVLVVIWAGSFVFGTMSTFLVLIRLFPEQTAMIPGLMNVLLLVFFIFLSLSAITKAIEALFGSSTLPLLLSMPIDRRTIFNLKLYEVFFSGSPFFLLMCVPVLIVFGIALNSGIWYYIFLVLNCIIILLIPTTVGFLIAMLLVKVMNSKRASRVVAAISAISFISVWFGYVLFVKPATEDGVESLGFLEFFASNPLLANLPSSFISNSLLNAANGNLWQAASYVILMGTVTLGAYLVCISLADNIYYSGWSGHSEAAVVKKSEKEKVRTKKSRVPILRQDLRMIKRVGSFLLLYLIQYIIAIGITLFFLSVRYLNVFEKAETYVNYLPFIGIFALTIYGMGGTTMLIPMWGRSFWIYKMLPMPMRRLLKEKFLLSFGSSFFCVTLMAMTLFFNPRFELYLIPFVILICCFFSIGSSSIGLLFSCLGPNFNWEKPKKLLKFSTGIFAAASMIFYCGLFFSLVAGVSAIGDAFLGLHPAFTGSLVLIPTAILSLSVNWLFFKIGEKSLNKLEWTF